MKVELKHPYAKQWLKGYVTARPDGRKVLTLYNSPKIRSSVNYARYLLEVELGRFLGPNEHADHRDDDRTNDSPSNLRVRSASLNIADGNRSRRL